MGLIRSIVDRLGGRGGSSSLRRDLSVAFFGHGGQRALRLITFVIMTRVLSVEAWALYALATTCFEIALYVSDFGLNVGVVRFVSKDIRTGETAAVAGVLRAVFLCKVVAGLGVCSIGYVVAPYLAATLDAPALTPYLRVAFVGVLGTHLHRFYEAYFRSRLEFERNAGFSMIGPALIAGAVALLWWKDGLTALRCQGIHALAPLVSVAFAAWALPHGFLRSQERGGEPLVRVWRFGRWVYLTNVLGKVRSELNAILLALLASLIEVGLYAYAARLAGALSLISTTLTTVYMPRASHLLTREEFRALLGKTYRAFFWLVPLVALLPFVAPALIRLHKPEYVAAAPLFVILFVSILFTMLALPARTVLYSMNRPQVETTIQTLALLVALVCGIALIRGYGVVGAAWAMLIQRGISSSILIGYVTRAVRNRGDADRGRTESGPLDGAS